MRLLNTRTLEFAWIDDPSTVDYATLSHVWSEDGEQSYQELMLAVPTVVRKSDLLASDDRISAKIRRCCARALKDGYEYIWIDSCCIDKSSSAELSEAINSMYKWYEGSSRCYAILHDVDRDDNPGLRHSQFRKSVWFTRGWTLQELIAPALVVFLSNDWNPIGTKHNLASLIEEITGVDVDILTGARSPTDVSIARRMSWAANRLTTREEDGAYSLLGLFGIHMPTIYGEGQHAFIRLQEEILKQIPDDTLFAWGRRFLLEKPADLESFDQPCVPDDACDRLFAASPSDFSLTADLRPISHDKLFRRLGMLNNGTARRAPPTYTSTRFGIRAELPMLAFQQQRTAYTVAQVKIGFLLCEDAEGRLVALILRTTSKRHDPNGTRKSNYDALLVGARIPRGADKKRWLDHRLVTLTGDVLDHLRQTRSVSPSVVHISRGVSYATERRLSSGSTHEPSLSACKAACSLLHPPWRKTALASQGVAVKESVMDGPSKFGSEDGSGRRYVFELAYDGVAFVVTVDICMRTLCFRMHMRISARGHASADGDRNKGGVAEEEKPVELSSRREGVKSIWECTLRSNSPKTGKKQIKVLRLSITTSESPRDLVLILDIELLDHSTSETERNSMGTNSNDSERRQSGGGPEILPVHSVDNKDAAENEQIVPASRTKRQSYLRGDEAVATHRTASRIPIRRPEKRRPPS